MQNNEGCELFESVYDVILLIEAYASAAHTAKPNGVSAKMLSKVFQIGYDEVQQTLDITTQLNRRNVNAKPSQNFSTNDRMLRYRQINSLFSNEEISLCRCLCPKNATSFLCL